jgi:hypothetical protein
LKINVPQSTFAPIIGSLVLASVIFPDIIFCAEDRLKNSINKNKYKRSLFLHEIIESTFVWANIIDF